MTFWLRLQGTRFPVRCGETVIGRSPYCSVVVSNPLTSRRHCALRLDNDGLQVADLGSANGTLVNGELLQAERRLQAGDVIRIGEDVLEVLETPTIDQRARASTQRDDPPEETTRHGLRAISEAPPSAAHSTLALVEALIERGGPLEHAPGTLRMIQSAIDGLVAAEPKPVNGAMGARIHGILRRLDESAPRHTLEPWRSHTLALLAPQAP